MQLTYQQFIEEEIRNILRDNETDSYGARQLLSQRKWGNVDDRNYSVVVFSAFADALAHLAEELWSSKGSLFSDVLAMRGVALLKNFIQTGNLLNLVNAVHWSQKNIIRKKTNLVHAIANTLTLNYKLEHGIACGLLLPDLVDYVNYLPLAKLLGFKSTRALSARLRKLQKAVKINNFNSSLITNEAFDDANIFTTDRPSITKEELSTIIDRIAKKVRRT